VAFERVYTVWDYWDGPRSGIALHAGQPQFYRCEWNIAADEYSDIYSLAPIDEDTLRLALEQWAIWKEWEAAFHRGEVLQSSHPALPGTDEQYSRLQQSIEAHLSQLPAICGRKLGVFRACADQEHVPSGIMRELEVEWQDVVENSSVKDTHSL
jgi:hypothetical protein